MKREIQTPETGTPDVNPEKHRIEIDPMGPYHLYGRAPINTYTITYDENGDSWGFEVGSKDYNMANDPTPLCRCGQSKNAPYCDGSHVKAYQDGQWDPTITAGEMPPLENAGEVVGDGVVLTDVEELCAFARFCDAKGRTWHQVRHSDDPEQKQLAIRTSQACPAGRLKLWDSVTGEPFEPQYDAAIGLIEDPKIRVSGGLFVMGGIPVLHPLGGSFQPRNRVVLCRCGQSRNKPYCDGTHSPAHYRDMLKK